MKWLAIANPAAGRARDAERVLRHLTSMRQLDVRIAHTSRPGDATHLAATAGDVDGVVAIGGDGTVAEVLQGLDRARHVLAILPAGHGNCLARDLDVANAERALQALSQAAVMPMDLLRVEARQVNGLETLRLCASTVAVGYVTEVVTLGRRHLAALGHVAYAAAAMLVAPAPFTARLAGAHGGVARRLTGIVINNTAHLANFRGFPDARLRDGLLDVMELGHRWPRQFLHNLAVLAGSRHFGPLALRQSETEHVELDEPKTLMLDGELLHGVVRLSVRCLPAAVRCVSAS